MASFPPPPVASIDWANVGFKVREGVFLVALMLRVGFVSR